MAVKANNITFRYGSKPALRDVTFSVEKGEFFAVLGANGSGKSTLARHLNGLLERETGSLSVWELDPSDPATLYELRRLCGMVFQNPENQFVSSVVEEDVAFGLRNYDTPEELIPQKVQAALALVGMEGSEKRMPHTLSGGQQQRVAMAGVLATEPELLVFDEATSMLDPEGRQEVLTHLKQLHRMGKTVVMITHYVEEAVEADRILLLKNGGVLRCGTPRELLTDPALMQEAGLEPPMAVQLYYALKEKGQTLSRCPLTERELVEELCPSK